MSKKRWRFYEEVVIVIFDTDIIIWVQRGNEKAAKIIDQCEDRKISMFSYLELMQSAHSKKQHKMIKDFLFDFDFSILPLSEKISHRASIYIEEYSLSDGIRAGDAIIAATAVEYRETLISSNIKHFRMIKELDFKKFLPT